MSDLDAPEPDMDDADPVDSSEERVHEEVSAEPPPPIDADEADARRGAAVWGGGAA